MVSMIKRSVFAVSLLALSACQAEPSTDTHTADTPTSGWATLDGTKPLVIAHRGASGERPEHTLSAYKLAIEQGADIIEPDLVMSKDGQLIIRHDGYLSSTTDIADHPEFADRRRTLFDHEDWWAIDFTVEELKTLRARQPRQGRPEHFDGEDTILTFTEFLDFIDAEEAQCACEILIEPEVKAPSEHAAIGMDPLPVLIETLERYDLNRADAPIIIQSFDPAFLERLSDASPVRLAMLDGGNLRDQGYSLEDISAFAYAVGPYKYALIDEDNGESTGYLEAAHAAGLYVHTWTVRDDNVSSPFTTVEEELRHLYALGVDGVFTDFPATALAVRETVRAEMDSASEH